MPQEIFYGLFSVIFFIQDRWLIHYLLCYRFQRIIAQINHRRINHAFPYWIKLHCNTSRNLLNVRIRYIYKRRRFYSSSRYNPLVAWGFPFQSTFPPGSLIHKQVYNPFLLINQWIKIFCNFYNFKILTNS